MAVVPKFAEFGIVGDSLTTGNGGANGSVPLFSPFIAAMATAFSGSSPLIAPYSVSTPQPSNVATFNRGAPSWHIYAVAAQVLSTIRTYIQNLPTNVTDLIIEGGTNDATGGIDPNTTNTALLGCFTDAVARYPALRNVYVLAVACAGELWANVPPPAFSGNSLLAGTVDAAIDTQNALLSATTVGYSATNQLGQAITFNWIDMRSASIAAEILVEPIPPGISQGVLTVDGRHPKAGGLPVVAMNSLLSVITVQP